MRFQIEMMKNDQYKSESSQHWEFNNHSKKVQIWQYNARQKIWNEKEFVSYLIKKHSKCRAATCWMCAISEFPMLKANFFKFIKLSNFSCIKHSLLNDSLLGIKEYYKFPTLEALGIKASISKSCWC